MRGSEKAVMQAKYNAAYLRSFASFRFLCVFYLVLTFLSMPVFAMDSLLDLSVDDEIRRNYNPNKLEEDIGLPSLPKVLNEKEYVAPAVNKNPTVPTRPATPVKYSEKAQQPKKATVKTSYTKPAQKPSGLAGTAVMQKGTVIRVKLMNDVSDRTRRGSKLSFVSRYPVTTTYYTIPSGTTFTGEVVASHRPQLTGNGGLIVIRVNGVIIDDKLHPINAKVTKANYKFIFFNNIKGKRRYVASMFNSMKPGFRFFRKMSAISFDLARDGSSILVSPFSLAIGALGAAGNVMISPAIALFYKGNSIYLRNGSDLEIKLVEDMFVLK